MLGLFGISLCSSNFSEGFRDSILSRMTSRINKFHYTYTLFNTSYSSVGIIYRNRSANKDITIHKTLDHRVIAFNGYAKISREEDYLWSAEVVEYLCKVKDNNIYDFLLSLSGSFECVICNNKKLLLISDRFGSKKLFYSLYNNIFLFAPDPGMIIDAKVSPKDFNLEGTIQFLTSGFFIGDSTLDRNLKRFPFASIFERTQSPSLKDSFTRYWIPDPPKDKLQTIDDNLLNKFIQLFERSITSIVPLSNKILVPLSGGLDSRAIASFLSSNSDTLNLTALTYNFADELNIAKSVFKRLQFRKHIFISNSLLDEKFQDYLFDLIENNYSHCVLNQYFYTYFFKQILSNEMECEGAYDGIYLDILFSAPYTYSDFDINRFQKVYCKGVNALSFFSSRLKHNEILKISKNSYNSLINEIGLSNPCDSLQLSTLFYISGRLRRYVSESCQSRENYGYIFKPGFDYDLVDFAYKLSLPIRKGKLYRELFRKAFPHIYKIKYKDSYGNRKKTFGEQIKSRYNFSRMKISSATKGMLPYYTNQADYFFYKMDAIEKLKGYFFNNSYISDIFSEKDLQKLFTLSKNKFYWLNFFERVLMVQSFLKRFKY